MRVTMPAAEAAAARVLTAQVERLEAENRKLQAKVAELEMSRRLDRDAYGQVERTLGSLQSQLARQGDDLAFYRSIVSPADGIQGLRIQRFEVAPGAEPREVLLKLTLVQAMRHESLVSGLAQVTISGMQGDRPDTLHGGRTARPAARAIAVFVPLFPDHRAGRHAAGGVPGLRSLRAGAVQQDLRAAAAGVRLESGRSGFALMCGPARLESTPSSVRCARSIS